MPENRKMWKQDWNVPEKTGSKAKIVQIGLESRSGHIIKRALVSLSLMHEDARLI